MVRPVIWIAPIIVWAGFATAQQATDETVIDLTPMVDLMQSAPVPDPSGETRSEGQVPEAPDASDAPTSSDQVDGATAADQTSQDGAEIEPEASIIVDGPVRASVPTSTTEPAPQPLRVPLRPVNGDDPLRLFGEYDSADFVIDIPDPGAVTAFDIVMQSSVNILPETSEITVMINDAPAAVSPPFAFDAFASLPVDSSALVAGTNRITVTAKQAHRIFCGPEATFQIWTDIDARASGATLASGSLQTDGVDFAARASALESILVIASEPPEPALLAELSRKLGATETGRAPVLVVASPFDPAQPGPPVPRIAIRPDAAGGAELRLAADGAPVLILAPDVSSDALDLLLPDPPPLNDFPAVVPGTPSDLSDLGVDDIEIRRRYGRVDVRFALPETWMLAANQMARIELLYRYAEGLPPNALMLVKVNGTTVRLLPLYGEPGVILPRLPVGFPTRLIEPGVNEISFETIIPGDPPDEPCSPIDGAMAEIFADTSIVIPPSPQMAFPSVATVLRSLERAGIVLAEDAPADGLANAIGRALDVELIALDGGPVTGAATVTVASLAEVDRLPLTALGLTRRGIEDLLSGRNIVAGDPAAEEAAPPGPVDRLGQWIAGRWRALVQLGWPGDGQLAEWITGKQAVALMLIPDPGDRLSAWLIAAPGVDPRWLAAQIAAARLDPDGPKGEAALLSAEGHWAVWRPADTPPTLLEAVTMSNLRAVAGNYAAWSPGLYVGLLASLVFVSVIVGLVFVVRTRGRRKR
jgi:hypothetical protein